MKDKTQDVNYFEEWQKTINAFRDSIVDFGDRLAKLLPDVEIPEEEEDTWKMKCPYKNGDEYYLLKSFGDFQKMEWTNHLFDELSLIQGNIFTTEEAVNLEVKRRKLLTRFRAFRDECNGDWKADWKNHRDRKYFISFVEGGKLVIFNTGTINQLCLFSYFKNEQDAQRAIVLFGDEIKELFVDLRVSR